MNSTTNTSGIAKIDYCTWPICQGTGGVKHQMVVFWCIRDHIAKGRWEIVGADLGRHANRTRLNESALG